MTEPQRTPTVYEKLAMHMVWSFVRRIKHGRLQVILPDGTAKTFGPTAAVPQHTLVVRDYRFFTRLIWGGSIGLGESYIHADWECDDVKALLALFVQDLKASARSWNPFAVFMGGVNAVQHYRHRNTIAQSKSNITAHYDMGNAFFAHFLDETMTYSCAIFDHDTHTLAQAQQHKLNTILDKLDVHPQHHLLEIGFGWGSFAMQAVREKGCRVTGITLSAEQLQFAQHKITTAGLQRSITLKLCDYRQIQGSFDRIVAIEMLEAVGHRYLATFFRICDQLLTEGGKLVLQVIVIPHERYRAYRLSSDFMRKYIFPGGHLPSLAILQDIITSKTRLTLSGIESIGQHYATTLCLWQERFVSSWPAIQALGFSEVTKRTWEYYFSYCAAGFAQEYIDAIQLELVKDAPGGSPQWKRQDA